jgi:putative membrane protein
MVPPLHISAVITWMAGIFYLPRLYVYHSMEADPESATSKTFKIMERRLLRGIMNPSLIVVIITGTAISTAGWYAEGWFHAKMTLVAGIIACHMLNAKWRKDFVANANTKSTKFYRIVNEIPVLLLLAIIPLVIFKPF